MTGLLWAIAEARLDALQQQWELEGRVPAEHAAAVEAWARDRVAAVEEARVARVAELCAAGAGEAAAQALWEEERRGAGRADRWFVGNFYIDDIFSGAFDFYIEAVQGVVEGVLREFDVEFADGRWSVREKAHTANKTELQRAADTAGGSMEVLGVVVDVRGRGQRRLTEARAARYAAEGRALLGKRMTRRDSLESWVGKVIFASSAVAGLRASYQAVLATLEQSWAEREVVALGRAAWAQIELACELLECNAPTALWPDRSEMGSAPGRVVCFTFGDAARQPDAPPEEFVGYGLWLWVESEDTVTAVTGRWTSAEQALCPASLELHVLNMGRALALEERRRRGDTRPWDIVQLTDSRSARDIVMRVHAKGAAERTLLLARMEAMRSPEHCGCRAAVVHAHREWLQDCDDGSKGKLALMREGISARFGGGVHVVQRGAEEVPWVVRSLEPALLAHAAVVGVWARTRASRGRRGS